MRANTNNLLTISIILLALACTVAAGKVIYVDDGATGANDGSNWADAYNYLQDALAVAVADDEIWVAEGTYKPDHGGSQDPNDREATFELINGVGIYGGYAGFGEPDPNARDWQAYETILSGNINTPDFNDDNSYHVVTGSGTDATTVLDGFTITVGNANGAFPHGGGMYNNSGSPMVTNCTFSGNSASGYGGGIYNDYSSPTLTNCTFSGNSTNNDGGGMYNWNRSDPNLTNCTFSRNSARWDGGGMVNGGGSPTVTNCTFINNRADCGGGMNNSGGSPGPTVTNCTFSGNSADYSGGGMHNSGGSPGPTVTNCTFNGNSARQGGGMRNGSYSSPTVTNCTFSRNSADCGGGMDNFNRSNPKLTNCTFSGNSADYGGGMHNWVYSNPTLTNCTFSGNEADVGGGMRNLNTNPNLTNCILWGNSPDQIGGPGSPVVTYSCIQGGGFSDTGNIDSDPLFVDPNGPDGTTGTEDDDLRLQVGSPCIDAGNNAVVTVTTDLDGRARIINGDFDAVAIVDMGAYEHPRIIFVDADKPGGNGTSWANAYKYLQDALADPCSVTGSEIWVAKGTYKPDANTSNPTGTDDPCATFQLVNGVAIYGGFVGNETYRSARDWQNNETTLSGDINTPGDINDNSYHVVTGSGTDVTAVLDGFTITAGNANGAFPYNYGGGMYNDSGSPTVTECTFSGNLADDGGGMYNNESSPTLTNCTFSGNSANYYGGGMCNSSSSPTLTNCTFTANTSAGSGGGMYNYDNCAPKLTNCILWGNSDSDGADESAQIHTADGNSPVVAYCCIQGLDTLAGNNNIGNDPLFVDANGPDGIAGTEDDNLQLQVSSPCIDAGDPAGSYTGQTDMDGQERVMYSRVDMGVDEVFPIAGDFEPDEDVDGADLKYLADRWLDTPCVAPGWCDGADINRDGIANFADFAYFAKHWLAGIE